MKDEASWISCLVASSSSRVCVQLLVFRHPYCVTVDVPALSPADRSASAISLSEHRTGQRSGEERDLQQRSKFECVHAMLCVLDLRIKDGPLLSSLSSETIDRYLMDVSEWGRRLHTSCDHARSDDWSTRSRILKIWR